MTNDLKTSLQLRAYSWLVEDCIKQAITLLNSQTQFGYDSPSHRVLEDIRRIEKQLHNTGNNLEGAMQLLQEAKETSNTYALDDPLIPPSLRGKPLTS